MKRIWVILSILCILFLIAGGFRWDRSNYNQNYSTTVGKRTVGYYYDRWTGDNWIRIEVESPVPENKAGVTQYENPDEAIYQVFQGRLWEDEINKNQIGDIITKRDLVTYIWMGLVSLIGLSAIIFFLLDRRRNRSK